MEAYKFKTNIKNATFRGIKLINSEKGTERLFSIAWANQKRDWWKRKDQVKAKFFNIGRDKYDSGTVQYGIYIGRLAICVLSGKIK